MTPQQKKFVKYYLETSNATQSAIKAGYSVKNASTSGYQVLHRKDVQKEIAKQMAKIDNAKIMDLQTSLEYLTRIVTGEEKEVVALATQQGVETITREADLKTKISALKELIKNQPTQLDSLRDAQITKLRKETAILSKKLDNMDESDTNNNLTIELDNEPVEKSEDDEAKD